MSALSKYEGQNVNYGQLRGPAVQLDGPMLQKYFDLRSNDFSIKETADALGVSKHTIYRWKTLGKQGRGTQAHADLYLIECTIQEMRKDEALERAWEIGSVGYSTETREDGTEITKTSPRDAQILLNLVETLRKDSELTSKSWKQDHLMADGSQKKLVELVVSDDKKKVLMQAADTTGD